MGEEEFRSIIQRTYDSYAGEPGVLWLNDTNGVGTNPCVSGDTCLLTKQGSKRIDGLIDEPVEIWNGFSWSEVTPRITGENQEMLKIKFSDGREIRTTKYHTFHLADGYTGNSIKVEAKDLKLGDKLIKHTFPVISEGKSYENMYLQGFKSADGMDNYDFIQVYSTKYCCLERLGYRV